MDDIVIFEKEGELSENEQKYSPKDIQQIIDDSFYAQIETIVPLDTDQIKALENLNQYCVNTALATPEVLKDPRKIPYKSNAELKKALVAICLAQALINPRRKNIERKEFFELNISIYQKENAVKQISFGEIHTENVQAAIYWDVVEDWKLYYDKSMGGIKALVDEKTNLVGLDNFTRGGDPMYEFARFHRKYAEKINKQEEDSNLAVKDAFRTAVVQSVASEVTKQQLIEGKNPMDIINNLLSQTDQMQIGSARPKQNYRPEEPQTPKIAYKPKKDS